MVFAIDYEFTGFLFCFFKSFYWPFKEQNLQKSFVIRKGKRVSMTLCLYTHLFCVARIKSRASHMSRKCPVLSHMVTAQKKTEALLVYASKLWLSHYTQLSVSKLVYSNMLLNIRYLYMLNIRYSLRTLSALRNLSLMQQFVFLAELFTG